MGLSARTDVQPLGYLPGSADPNADPQVNQNGSADPVMTATGWRIPDDMGAIYVTVLDEAPFPLRFTWYCSGSDRASSAAGQEMYPGGASVPVPLIDAASGVDPEPVGLAIQWGAGEPYVNDDSWLFEDVSPSVATATSAPPVLSAVAPLTYVGSVVVEVVAGTPAYFFAYTMDGVTHHAEDMDRGSPVPLLNADDSESGLAITWPSVTAIYPGASYSWTVTKEIVLTAPVGGEVLRVGTATAITWTTAHYMASVLVEFSADGGGTWTTLAATAPATGSYTWTPSVGTVSGRVRVTGGGVSDTSAARFTVDDWTPPESSPRYKRQLAALLPPGALWRLEPDSWLSRLLQAVADEFARVEVRGVALVEESDPRTATETLDDWERVLGLPDADVLEIPETDAERRLAITQKLVRVGGQSGAYFIGLAAACGYTVTIDDAYGLTVCRAGRVRAGQPASSERWAYVWRMDVQAPTGTALSHSELEAIIRRVAPAHTLVRFTYL